MSSTTITQPIFGFPLYKSEGNLAWRNENKLICKQFCVIPEDIKDMVLRDCVEEEYKIVPTHFICESFYAFARGFEKKFSSVEIKNNYIIFNDGSRRKLRFFEKVVDNV
jgi:hypothetical protein